MDKTRMTAAVVTAALAVTLTACKNGEPSRDPNPTRVLPAGGAVRDDKVTHVSGYIFCGNTAEEAQSCIDSGNLTLYYPSNVPTLAGHDYMGWRWLDKVPVGHTVQIDSGILAGTYQVYDHVLVFDRSFPSGALGANVVLQTCDVNGSIGFSLLKRVYD